MNIKEIKDLAHCYGCPFMQQISGQTDYFCVQFAEGDPKIYPPCKDVEECKVKEGEIVNQLKLHEPKLGLGLRVEPIQDGDCQVKLVAASGVLWDSKLSDLFPNEHFTCIPMYRLVTEDGVDRTHQLLQRILAKAYDNAPGTKNVFGALLK